MHQQPQGPVTAGAVAVALLPVLWLLAAPRLMALQAAVFFAAHQHVDA